VGPLGFRITDRELKRAGLDYWRHVQMQRHPDSAEFWAGIQESSCHLFSTRGKRVYTEVAYRDGDSLIFGCETAGLPPEILSRYFDRSLFIPMDGPVRSLNLSTAVGIATYEALRQIRGPLWSEASRSRAAAERPPGN
jgi:tRNA (cytidine/uridine-2'-O-)-methyltransferase